MTQTTEEYIKNLDIENWNLFGAGCLGFGYLIS